MADVHFIGELIGAVGIRFHSLASCLSVRDFYPVIQIDRHPSDWHGRVFDTFSGCSGGHRVTVDQQLFQSGNVSFLVLSISSCLVAFS